MRKILVILILTALGMISPTLVLGQSKSDVLIKNATVMTAVKGTLENTDILIQNGKIAKIGKNLSASATTRVINAEGQYVTPGIIDCHSHTMLDAINEGVYSVTSMTRTRDVLNPTDIAIYRALAGGVTVANLLHGSANPIGGQNTTVKFKWGHPVEDYPIPDAPPGIKFAMGENVKRSTSFAQPGATVRYPRTRMGVIETMRDAFLRARDYRQAWADFKAGKIKVAPRKDLELEPLVEVIEGKRLVHAHGYRSDEHLNLMLLADEFGFKIATLQHGLEAYKIAPEIAKRGTGVSIFTDYWGYKLEAYDTIPYNAYILWKSGVVVSINSDDDERMRRLNLEAAKVIKYGNVPEEEALKMITLNPAKQLGIDKRTGSIEVGKDGDIVIWSGHPFSVYSRVLTTIVEGEVLFDRAADAKMRIDTAKERESLEKLDVNKAPGTGGGQPRIPSERRRGDRDDAEYSDGGNR
ncbi:MAG TPA: amidohydrolase [Pyrinomonadaceae bacterium]|nr:amidohydrolase family protein [Chloracidobacterium sp.]MBP9934513.1 amidohydrolase family protein [Pyrinomonadaceae bacterium]MBK7802485.1 amidohydrolase family protein [Chloracidobacterium sp.]MBK9437355.1 amidohydrolase family protein [Chloracidobacterium sp.]MBL0240029.1 amidohydrolase family protein [Chloracidobacterium sp.]